MAKSDNSSLPKLTAEQRRAAAGQHERALQVLASGNFDYGIKLLRNCCKLDPSSFLFRQSLRQAQKDQYGESQRGQRLSMLTSLPARVRLQAALKQGNYLDALEFGEDMLTRNPWDVGAHLGVAEAFEELDLLQLALWTLDQARQVKPKDIEVNRRLARVLEKRGNFVQAIKLWEFIRQAVPTDQEAQHKVKDLAASDTIARGGFEDAVSGGDNKEQEDDADAEETQETPKKAEKVPVTVRLNPVEERGQRDINALLEKIQVHPKNPNNYLHLASIYRRNDQLDKAREVLRQGLSPTGNHFELGIEILDLDIEPYRRNLEVVEAKLQREPDDAELQRLRARLMKEVNARELDYHRQKADRYPTEVVHRFEMGVRLMKVGQVDEAIKELQIVRNDPRHKGHALYYLGFCFKHRNNWRLAQRNFEEALQNIGATEDDMRKELLYQLAAGCAEAGDIARAIDLGCELANLDYSYRDISALLDEWQSRDQK